MTFLLPLVALALAFAAPFLSRPERTPVPPARIGALVLLMLVGAAVVLKAGPAADRTPAILGLVLGALAPLLGAFTGSFAPGVAAAAALHLFPANPSMGLAMIAGTGLGALAVGGEGAALAATLVFAADGLGARHSPIPAAAFVGSQVGVTLAVGGLVAAFLPKGTAFFRPVLVGILALLGSLLSGRALGDEGTTLCAGVGALAGVVLHFLMPDEEGESPRVGLAAIVGIGLATVAYGLGRGAGMGLAALAAVGVLLAVDNRRALLAFGPLVGLVLYRVLREAGTGATRALDIAQHYTLLALVLGLALPLIPSDWLGRLGGGRGVRAPEADGASALRSGIGVVLWGVVAIAVAPLVVVALGMRGGIGFVVGLGTSGLVQAMRSPFAWEATREEIVSTPSTWEATPAERTDVSASPPSADSPMVPPSGRASLQGEPSRTLLPLALGAGLAGSTILALAWLGDDSALSRDAKVHLFAYAAVGLALIAGMLALVGRPKVVAK